MKGGLFDIMRTFWFSLSLFQQILLCVAVPVTVVLLIQFFLLLFGIGDDNEPELTVDLDGDGIPDDVSNIDDGMSFGEFGGLRLLTLRGVLAFFSLGSGAALIASSSLSAWAALAIGVLAGVLADVLYAWIMRMVLRLQENGAIRLENAVGVIGEVYIPIPPAAAANGKINLVLHGKLCEQEAVWYGDHFLPTGTKIRVVRILGDTLVVEPLSLEKENVSRSGGCAGEMQKSNH